ncbi:MAG: asparaginase [Bacteroidetes bacterium CG12_big_fil_rev_8_21_14_0_65_60_17]|nr:MAG: asparaginase [Bacteroidetes bacterium CG12_big_fil_rev_8_21_14_0_65_60_17]
MTLHIITTGGTIDKVYFDAKSEYTIGDPMILDILQTAGVDISHEITQLFQKDSLEITPEDRQAIVDVVCSSPHSLVMITHGTDTMVNTLEALAPVCRDKTVVLVGSLSPARFKGTDAEFNIGFALGAVQALPPGAYIAMNGRVFREGNVRKNRAANRFETLL